MCVFDADGDGSGRAGGTGIIMQLTTEGITAQALRLNCRTAGCGEKEE